MDDNNIFTNIGEDNKGIIEYDNLKTHIDAALDKLYENDSYLITYNIHERSIVFRFCLYFYDELRKNVILSDYDLDVEYNKNGEDLKST